MQTTSNDAGGAVTLATNDAAAIADRFLTARRAAAGLAAYPGDMPSSLDEAYEIQDAAIAAWNRPVVGWKVGRVPPPLVRQFGTDRLAGPVFVSRVAESDGGEVAMPVFDEGFAAAEAEFLLRIGRAPDPTQMRFTMEQAAELIDAVHVGIEVASSPLRAINDLGPVAVVSDFGNNNGLVVGAAVPGWRTSGFEQWSVMTLIDGAEVGTGSAAAFPDGALGSVRFLFELMARRGIRLGPGQWISSGAVTGVHDAHPGQSVEAQFNSGLSVRCRLLAARPE
jgi:2-keto-4-pentenoate hydratase